MSAFPLAHCPGCGMSSLETAGSWSHTLNGWYCERCFSAAARAAPEPDPFDTLAAALDDGAAAQPAGEPSSNGAAPAEDVAVVSLREFISVEEPGAEPLVGSEDDNLIPEGGDVMFYGDGGTAKTTLAVDLAYHMGSAKDWLGYAIAQPARVLLIENEGPRALFRLKLKRKDEAWAGPPTEDRISVLERPWATFTFATPDWRERLAKTIIARRISVVIAGPVVTLGMNTAGTLQEVRAFMKLIADLRTRIDWPLTVILIHHENKGGAVSGAWEGAGDTLMHTSGAGHGHTILFVQKARWASASHHTTLKLAWADGDGFDVEGDRDLMAEVRALFQENAKPRTKEELGDELGVSKNTVADLIKENPNAFDELTGEAARALGRHPTSKLYILASEVVPASGPPGTTS